MGNLGMMMKSVNCSEINNLDSTYLKNDFQIFEDLPVYFIQFPVSNVFVCWSLKEAVESLSQNTDNKK